jgi:hypothetical protein
MSQQSFTTDLSRVDPIILRDAEKSITILNQCSAFTFELVALVQEDQRCYVPYAVNNSFQDSITIALRGSTEGNLVRFEYASDNDHDTILTVLRAHQHLFLDPTKYVHIDCCDGLVGVKYNLESGFFRQLFVYEVDGGYGIKTGYFKKVLFKGSSEEVIEKLQELANQQMSDWTTSDDYKWGVSFVGGFTVISS